MTRFLDLNPADFSGAILLVDVDGTLVYDRGRHLDPFVLRKVRDVAQVAEVHLCSNGPLERTRQFAQEAGVYFIESLHAKPSRRVVEALEDGGRRVVVIGDKVLVDGLFAANIGAEFVRVAQVRHVGDNAFVRGTYALDNLASLIYPVIRPLLPFIILMRPQQWIKSAFVFAPIAFAGTLFEPLLFWKTACAAVLFSLTASAIYVLNDIADVAQDRAHPTKRGRPIASGAVSVMQARILAALLLGIVFFGLTFLPMVSVVIGIYVVLNVLYTFALKHTPLLDLACIAVFYLLRVFAGGAATNTYISPWIVSCVLFGALFLAIGKRRAELSHRSTRRVLRFYSRSLLDAPLVIAACVAVLSYGLYAIYGAHSPYVIYSTPLVAFAVLRVVLRVFNQGEEGEYPESLVFKDRWVLAAGFLWTIFMLILLYV